MICSRFMMVIKSRRRGHRRIFRLLLIAASIFGVVVLYCEFLVHVVAMMQCEWPVIQEPIMTEADSQASASRAQQSLPEPLRALFLADPHILGPVRSMWLDRLLRDWQMKRMFHAAMTVLKPHVVFILGDLFEEGLWASNDEFDSYVIRYHSVFPSPKSADLYVLVGNHDIGFFHEVTPELNNRFEKQMHAPSVRRISINGTHFILINSVLLEGNGCELCNATEDAIKKIGGELECFRGNTSYCANTEEIQKYSRPVLLQHFPLFRESDEICHELDEAPPDIKNDEFKERWDCLSKEATEQLLDILNPRLVVDGHTHHGCRTEPRENILEVTVPSFNWRNKNNPSILLGTFTPDSYAVSKCYLTVQTTVIAIYVISVISLIACLFWIWKSRKPNRHPLETVTGIL